MSKAAIALAGLAVVGGGLFFMSRNAKASTPHGGAPIETVTGKSGTVYQVQLVNSEEDLDGAGTRLTFAVIDAAGIILEYMQFQGDNDHRILVRTPDAVHPEGDPIWLNAVSDFGIFTSVA